MRTDCYKLDIGKNAWTKMSVSIYATHSSNWDSHPDWGLLIVTGKGL